MAGQNLISQLPKCTVIFFVIPPNTTIFPHNNHFVIQKQFNIILRNFLDFYNLCNFIQNQLVFTLSDQLFCSIVICLEQCVRTGNINTSPQQHMKIL